MALKLITAAATMPVSLASVKLHCGVEDNSFDPLLAELLADAVNHVEELLGRSLGEQTWLLALDAFADTIELPRGPVLGIANNGFRYYDLAGAPQAVSAELYTLDLVTQPSWIVRNEGAAWPETMIAPNAVEVTFTAGWTEATLPRALRRAVCVLVAAWFEDRTASAPATVEDLVQPYRTLWICA